MKTIFLAASLFMLSSFPSGCEVESKDVEEKTSVIVIEKFTGPEEELAALQESGDRLIDAFLREDLDALMEGFTVDAVLIPAGQPVLKGKSAIRVHYSTLFDEFEVLEFGPTLEEAVIQGDWAYTRGTASVVGCSESSGDKVRQFSRGMEIWRKENDTWLIARAIGNH